jgi:hypothetical protein
VLMAASPLVTFGLLIVNSSAADHAFAHTIVEKIRC